MSLALTLVFTLLPSGQPFFPDLSSMACGGMGSTEGRGRRPGWGGKGRGWNVSSGSRQLNATGQGRCTLPLTSQWYSTFLVTKVHLLAFAQT